MSGVQKRPIPGDDSNHSNLRHASCPTAHRLMKLSLPYNLAKPGFAIDGLVVDPVEDAPLNEICASNRLTDIGGNGQRDILGRALPLIDRMPTVLVDQQESDGPDQHHLQRREQDDTPAAGPPQGGGQTAAACICAVTGSHESIRSLPFAKALHSSLQNVPQNRHAGAGEGRSLHPFWRQLVRRHD